MWRVLRAARLSREYMQDVQGQEQLFSDFEVRHHMRGKILLRRLYVHAHLMYVLSTEHVDTTENPTTTPRQSGLAAWVSA